MIPNSSDPNESFIKAVTLNLDSQKKVEVPLEERLLMEITNKTLDIHDSVQKLARTISDQRGTIVFKDEALKASNARYDVLVEQHTKDAHNHAVTVKGLLDKNIAVNRFCADLKSLMSRRDDDILDCDNLIKDLRKQIFDLKAQSCVREEEVQTCNLVVKSQRDEIAYLKKSMETMNRALKSQEDSTAYATGELRKIRSSVIYAIRYSIGLV